MMRNISRLIIFLVALLWCSSHLTIAAAESKTVSLAELDTSLREQQSFLPDFSYAGYHLSEKELPVVSPTSHRYFSVIDYGAVPDDGLSDEEAILAANRAAHAHDGPVVLYFPKGRYLWGSPDRLFVSQIKITRSNFVIRGEGAGIGGTIIEQVSPFTRAAGWINPIGKGFLIDIGHEVDAAKLKSYQQKTKTRVTNIEALQPGVQFSLEVSNSEWIQPGMVVKLETTFPDDIDGARRFFSPSELSEEKFISTFKGRDYRRNLSELHRVSKVDNHIVTFEDPILLDFTNLDKNVFLLPVMDPGQSYVTEVGVEDIALSGGYKELYFHYFGGKNTSGHFGIRFGRALNSWAKSLRLKDFNVGMKFKGALYSTAQNVDFTGNSGHFTVTCQDGANGILLSCIREIGSGHHGFGATQKTKNIVYHRCVQAGNYEAHGGFPRATLFDFNDGLFGMIRTGGGAPHHGRLLTYWNWNNTRFDERPELEPDFKGDSPEEQLDSVDFSAKGTDSPKAFPPIIVGLHGDPISLLNPEESIQLIESMGSKVAPESLFEAQLRKRTGQLPKGFEEQVRAFEDVKRYARIEFESPRMDSVHLVGHPIRFNARFPERFNTKHIKQVDLYMSRDSERLGSLVSSGMDTTPLQWSPSEPGVHVTRLCLTDSLGGTTLSRPLYLFVQGRHDHMARVIPQEGWLLNGSLLKRYRGAENEAKKAYGISGEPEDYFKVIQENREISKPLFSSSNEFIETADALIDANLETGMTIANGLYNSPRLLIFDLGEKREICRIDIVRGFPTNPLEQVAWDIKASNDPEAIYDYTNGLEAWQDGLRVVGATRHHFVTPTPADRTLTTYFPETEAQFFQIFIKDLNPKEIQEVIFYERGEYITNKETESFDIW